MKITGQTKLNTAAYLSEKGEPPLSLLDEHQRIVTSRQPVENHMMFIWQMINLELWLRWLEEM